MSVICGFAEVVLNVRDMDAMVRFYADVVGLRPHSRFPFDDPTIVFLEVAALDSALGRAHPQLLVLIDPARHGKGAHRFDTIDQRRSALNHMAFEIEEYDHERELERLAGLGVTTSVVRFEHVCAKAIFYEDPEGNMLELVCCDSTVTDEDARLAALRLDQKHRSDG